MTAGGPSDGATIGGLFAQLIDDGRELVRAELRVYRELAIHRAVASRTAMALVLAGVLVAFGSVTAMLVGLVLGLARLIGPVGAGLCVGVIGLAVAALLIRAAFGRFEPFDLPDDLPGSGDAP